MKRRSFFTYASTSLIISQQPGCITRHLYAPHEYKEIVSSVLISSDRKSLVFLSENYHYIFETNPPLIFSIDPEVQKYIKASINGVHVDGNGQCSLGYNINISSDAPIDIYNKSLNNGFQKNIYTNGTYNTGKILGTRYVANGSKIEPKSTPRKLSRQYEVLVTSEMSAAEKIKKAPYTPISIIADGAIGIGTMVLMPFIFPLLIGGK